MNSPITEYRPELLPRRGEWVAWGLALLVAGTWLWLLLSRQRASSALPLLAAVLFFSATSISMGNWMDRHTLLVVDADGVRFENGLRHIQMKWQEINEVRLFPATWGNKVQVFGENVYFHFHTLGEVKYRGEVRGKTGFAKGEEIMRHIILNSSLEIVDHLGEVYYYARR
jgi:hypothetical protein